MFIFNQSMKNAFPHNYCSAFTLTSEEHMQNKDKKQLKSYILIYKIAFWLSDYYSCYFASVQHKWIEKSIPLAISWHHCSFCLEVAPLREDERPLEWLFLRSPALVILSPSSFLFLYVCREKQFLFNSWWDWKYDPNHQ